MYIYIYICACMYVCMDAISGFYFKYQFSLTCRHHLPLKYPCVCVLVKHCIVASAVEVPQLMGSSMLMSSNVLIHLDLSFQFSCLPPNDPTPLLSSCGCPVYLGVFTYLKPKHNCCRHGSLTRFHFIGIYKSAG